MIHEALYVVYPQCFHHDGDAGPLQTAEHVPRFEGQRFVAVERELEDGARRARRPACSFFERGDYFFCADSMSF